MHVGGLYFMYYVLFFVALITIQWVLFVFFMNAGIKRNCGIPCDGEAVKQIWRKRYCVLICAEMIVFTGIRATDVGADTSAYLTALAYYRNLPRGSIMSAKLVYPFDFEVGYFFLTKLCAYLNFSSTAFLFVISSLIYVPVFVFIYRYSKSCLTGILIYFAFGFFVYSLGIFRQMIAISICLTAIPYIKKKKLIRYLLICIFASLFHFTAVVMIPLYFLGKIDLKKYKIQFYIAVLIIQAFCFVYARDIIIAMLKIFKIYSGYVGGKYDVQGGTYLNLIFLNILLFMGVFFVVPHVDKENFLWVIGIALACIIQSCAYQMGIMGRLVYYYSVFEIALIPLVSENLFIDKKYVNIGVVGALFLLILRSVNRDEVLQGYRFLWN